MVDRPLDEAELVERARHGDLEAWETLVRTYQGIAFRTAYLLAGNAADAEEAAQDGFVKAQRALGRFRRGAPLKPWLLRIVANEARNRRRSAGRRERLVLRAIEETRPGDAVPSPEAALLAREDQERLLAARRAPARRPAGRDRLPLPARALRGGDRGRAGDPSWDGQVAARACPRAAAREPGGRGMSSLEQRLQELGRELAFPPEPDLVGDRAHGRQAVPVAVGRARGGSRGAGRRLCRPRGANRDPSLLPPSRRDDRAGRDAAARRRSARTRAASAGL